MFDAFICCISLESGTITCGAAAIKKKKKSTSANKEPRGCFIIVRMLYNAENFFLFSVFKCIHPFDTSECYKFPW